MYTHPYDSIPNTAAPLVVHEGDGPKHLARQCLAYYRRVECERKAAATAAEGGEHAAAATNVSAKVKGRQCESESAAMALLDVEQVDVLSKAVTAQFKKYFEHT